MEISDNRKKAIELVGIISPFVGVSISNSNSKEDVVGDLLNTLEKNIESALDDKRTELVVRVKQLLTALDYDTLTEFQLRVIASLQKEMLKP